MATLIPFLPSPTTGPMCGCGEPLEMEMEIDACTCVECMARDAQLRHEPLVVFPRHLTAMTGSGKTMAALQLAMRLPSARPLFITDRSAR